ncbi:hypothetical protein JCM19237_1020 [Photobacterium aphoticum]|uniref:Uncharacterized protein n=1 Tax=Photobacterium aphoticum TaxID=754436 RepID=A0A090QQ10_9GAMM|nr:hypothetical protein JCM19237_1020 [Photobacterium aphoticum]
MAILWQSCVSIAMATLMIVALAMNKRFSDVIASHQESWGAGSP